MRSVIRSLVPGGHRILPVRSLALTAGVAVVLVPGLMLASSAQAAPHHQASARQPSPHVTHQQSPDSGLAVHHDRSLPLRVLAARAHHVKARHRVAPDKAVLLPHPPASRIPDPVIQRRPGIRPAVATTANFDGFSDSSSANLCGCAPPDPNAAVGTTQVVEIVNTAFAEQRAAI